MSHHEDRHTGRMRAVCPTVYRYSSTEMPTTVTAITVPDHRPPPAKYNRGNRLVTMTAKIAADERSALEAQAAREGKSVSAVAREAIQRHVRRATREGVSAAA